MAKRFKQMVSEVTAQLLHELDGTGVGGKQIKSADMRKYRHRKRL
jgi:hypothetical protein